jgi:aspartyl aminopeptidase
VLSADVTTGVNPLFPDVQAHGNAAKLGQGVVIKVYGRGNSPNSEFTARFRGILEKANIPQSKLMRRKCHVFQAQNSK